MCFKRKKQKHAVEVPTADENQPQLFDGPFFTIDMVPVSPAMPEDMKPDVKPEEFAVYDRNDNRAKR